MPPLPPSPELKKPAAPAPAKAGFSQAPSPAPAPAAAPTTGQQRFDRMAVRAKMAVSQPGDALEHQADAIADKVMRMPDHAGIAPTASPTPTPSHGATPLIQRRVKGDGTTSPEPPAAASPGNEPSVSSDVVARLGAGEGLDADARSFFEQRLSRDLSDVRIHADAAAADAARTLQARAFAWGNHIAFASDEYQPGTEDGRRLMAHELAHVLQNDTMDVDQAIARKKATNPKYADPNDLSDGAFDPAQDKKARPELERLKLPAIKSRHADYYRQLAKGGTLKRPFDFDRKKPPYQTDQVRQWKEPLDLSGFYADIGFEDGGGRQSLMFYGAKPHPIKGTEGEVLEQIKIPNWTPDGSWRTAALQVDHVLEMQLGGKDRLDNYELLTGLHNITVGSLLRATIYANVATFLDANGKNSGRDNVREFLTTRDVYFRNVVAGADSEKKENVEGKSQFWSRADIVAGKHLAWLKDEAHKTDDGNRKDRFALYSYSGNSFIDAFGLKQNKVGNVQNGRLTGLKIDSIKLKPGFEAASAERVGLLHATWALPKDVEIEGGKKVESELTRVPGKKYAGALREIVPKGTIKGASPVAFEAIGFARGQLAADGTLTTSHPLFPGVQIPVRWRGDQLAFEYTFPIDQLAGKLPIPGVSIDSASLTLFFGTRGLGADGAVNFTVAGFGAGMLSFGVAHRAAGPDLWAQGSFTADRKLFDQASIEIGYSTARGLYGSGVLGITTPGKIKGLKAASIRARFEAGGFAAKGEVEPDIPGLKSASLSVGYGHDTLQITGTLGIDDKVPGVEKADIEVSVTRGPAGWRVGAAGLVTPKLPGLSGSQLRFSYDEGSVLVEGEFEVHRGPLDGKVTAGITNAEVDDKGVRAARGEGGKFRVFGAADVRAVFLKDKLAGTLKLRLLPDGSVRVGGGLAVADFELFGQLPKDGGPFLDQTFSTPEVPLPGLGFSVGPVSVGLTISASLNAKANAAIGPGRMTGITLTVAEFDPANGDLDTLEIGGGATFLVFANVGFTAGAQVNLKLSALVASLTGSVGVEGSVGLPPDHPILTAASQFTFSVAKGLDIMNSLQLDISPELRFRLFGEIKAKLELLVTTITVWHRDFTLAEANFKLPVGIKASGSLGYNSKTGQLTPANPSDAIHLEQPALDGAAMQGIVMGDAAPTRPKTLDDQGREVSTADAMRTPPVARPMIAPDDGVSRADGDVGADAFDAAPLAPDASVMRSAAAAAPPPLAGIDEGLIGRLGAGMPLELATRGYFEQRMKADLAGVQLHIGPAAAREAERLQARAFTVGDHVAFAAGEYRPNTPEGQSLIAHELAHIAQRQGTRGDAIVLRWPAVTRTDAHSAETPAAMRARTLGDFSMLTQQQLDWATSAALQADDPTLQKLRSLRDFSEEAQIVEACGGMSVGRLIDLGLPVVAPPLRRYAAGVSGNGTAWLRQTDDADQAERWGQHLGRLEAAWSPADLALVMPMPDPATSASSFERLDDPHAFELDNFINYLRMAPPPVLSAEDGSEIGAFLSLRAERVLPNAYQATVHHVRNYHHFTKATLDGLAANEAVPWYSQQFPLTQRPLIVVLYPAVDYIGAFHRNAGLDAMVANTRMLTIVIEGMAHVADYTAALAPVAARYGVGGRISQALIGGHGNYNVLELAGSVVGGAEVHDNLGTSGAGQANTTALMTELTRLMADPAHRRIVLDACLTNSHLVTPILRPAPADAAADVIAAIAADPNLRDMVASIAGVNVFGSNSSFAPQATSFMAPASDVVGLGVPDDPDLIASKLRYVEVGTEPGGCMRALLETWSDDRSHGTHAAQDAVKRRLGLGRSPAIAAKDFSSWRESIVHACYKLALNQFWNNGDMIRQLGFLAESLFELQWPKLVSVARLNTTLTVLGGNVAHVDAVLTPLTTEPTYASPRVAIAIEQAWMQHNPVRRAQFMAALGHYTSCLQAAKDLDMALVMPSVPALVTLPPAAPPPVDQLKLALLAAKIQPLTAGARAPFPAHIAWLRALLGAGPTFAPALGIGDQLGGLMSETDLLTAIGRPLNAAPDPHGPPPAANLDPLHDATHRNDMHVAPLRANGRVTITSAALMVRSTPTTSTDRNIFARLPSGATVLIVGEFGRWYAIEQPGRSGFVAKQFLTLF